jgi:hypothetical protein
LLAGRLVSKKDQGCCESCAIRGGDTYPSPVRNNEERNSTKAIFLTGSPKKTLQTAINEARVNRDRLAARVF